MSQKTYRSGVLGALMDELERATGELVQILEALTDDELLSVRNPGAAGPALGRE